jgi:V/A-type H+-transporting ATPase subunit C
MATSRTTVKTKGKDYGYGNARIRGMRARLLDAQFYERLIDTGDLARMIAQLEETEYAHDLEEQLLHGRTAAQVDEALKENMIRTFRKVLNFLEGEGAFLMLTLLGRWDLFSVKTIIRGKHLGMTADEIITNLVPAGQLSQAELAALAKCADVRTVVDTMATWGLEYAVPLREAVGEYTREGDISVLELALDRYYAQWAAMRLRKRNQNFQLAAWVMAIQIDITNLMTVMRLQKADVEDLDVTRFFLPGGLNIDLNMFIEMAGFSDIDELLDRLKGTPYGKALDEVSMQYIEVGSIAVFERALEDYLMRKALASGTGDPLGVGVIVNYLWAKHNEVTNLRIIVKGISVGMPEDRVRKELILV